MTAGWRLVRIIDAEVTGWRGRVLRYPNIVTQSTLDSAGCIFSSGSTLVSQSWLVRISRINCEEMRMSRAVRRALTERRRRTVHWFDHQHLPRLPFWLHWPPLPNISRKTHRDRPDGLFDQIYVAKFCNQFKIEKQIWNISLQVLLVLLIAWFLQGEGETGWAVV